MAKRALWMGRGNLPILVPGRLGFFPSFLKEDTSRQLVNGFLWLQGPHLATNFKSWNLVGGHESGPFKIPGTPISSTRLSPGEAIVLFAEVKVGLVIHVPPWTQKMEPRSPAPAKKNAEQGIFLTCNRAIGSGVSFLSVPLWWF